MIGIIILLAWERTDLKTENKRLKQLSTRDLWLIKERIKLLSPTGFENLCGNLFRLTGYYAKVTDPVADGGKDIILKKKGITTFVECKHWLETDENKTKVSRPIAQKLRGSMDYGTDGKTPVTKGIIITTAGFTNECLEYCNAMNIECWDFADIMKLVKEVGTQELYPLLDISYDGNYLFE
jgi:HJR/Mrr/RecB family endonuclease